MGFVKRHEIAIFVILAFLLSWIFWVPLEFFRLDSGNLGNSLYNTGVLGPLVAALELVLLSQGRNGVVSLFKGLVRWRTGVEWYVVAMFLPLAIEFVVLFTIALSGTDVSFNRPFIANAPIFIGQAFYALASTIAIFGFLLPRLLRSYSPLASSLIAAAFSIAWRAPFIVMSINAGRADYEFWWALGNLGTFFVFTWLFYNTKGSLLLLTLFDFSLNYFRWFSRGVMQASPVSDQWGLDFSLHAIVGIIILLASWKYFMGKAPAIVEVPDAVPSG